MGKGSVLFVLVFSAALIYAKYREGSPPRAPKQTKLQQQPQSLTEWPKVKRMLVTAYCPCKICCGKNAKGLTSTGKNAWQTDGVAADLSLLPRNTELVIPGVGIRVVDDTGGAMRQSAKKDIYHIDVRFHSHKEALQFGKKKLDVTILGPAG